MATILLVARLLLGVVFLVAGLAKLVDRAGSRQSLRDFGVPARLATPFGTLLPLAELAVAVALVPTRTTWWGALGSLALLLLFVVGIGSNLARGRHPDCHCFGQLHSAPAGWPALIRNLVLAAIAGLVVVSGRGTPGLGLFDWPTALPVAQHFEVVAGLVVVALLVGAGWLLVQVMAQQGRLLLRLGALEAGQSDSSGLPPLSAPLEPVAAGLPESPMSTPAPTSLSYLTALPVAAALSRAPVSTEPMEAEEEIELTIGMATYNDFDGVYFTLQALRLYQDLEHVELLVIDNYGCEHTQRLVEGWLKGRYIRATEVVGTAAPRELVFRHARGQAVLCCDSHILFAPGVIARLKQYYREHPDCQDLLQGPMLYDDGKSIATHFEPRWREQMWGVWGNDPRGQDPEGDPFEIPMQGLGVFSCRKAAWLGFHPQFRGFGGEEGYIHEKFRQAGRHCLCLPWLRWMHRFGRPNGVFYPLTVDDKLRNYVLGHAELGLDLLLVLEHFTQYLPQERVRAITEETLGRPWTGAPFLVEAEGWARRGRHFPAIHRKERIIFLERRVRDSSTASRTASKQEIISLHRRNKQWTHPGLMT